MTNVQQKLFSLDIQIEGKAIKIHVYEHSNIHQVAANICTHYTLHKTFQQYIYSTIMENLNAILHDQEAEQSWKQKIQTIIDLHQHEQQDVKQNKNPHQNHKYNKQISEQQRKSTLYDKALKLQRKKKQLEYQRKLAQQKKEIQECTFHPVINKPHTPYYRPNIYEVLYDQAKTLERKKQRLRKMKQAETEQFTFTPQLNDCSKKIMQMKEREPQPYDSSYLQKKMYLKEPQFSFHPTLSEGTKKIAKDFPSFERRQEQYKSKKKNTENVQNLQQISLNNISLCNNRSKQFFKNPSKQKQRRERLYSGGKNVKKTQEIKIQIQKNKKSQELFQIRKARIFNNIFQGIQLNGVVSQFSINKHMLHPQLFNIILPLLNQIAQLSVELNKQEFLQSLDALFLSLNPSDKNKILNFQSKLKWESQHQQYKSQYKFKPQISGKSKQLAARKKQRIIYALKKNIKGLKQLNYDEDIKQIMEEDDSSASEGSEPFVQYVSN